MVTSLRRETQRLQQQIQAKVCIYTFLYLNHSKCTVQHRLFSSLARQMDIDSYSMVRRIERHRHFEEFTCEELLWNYCSAKPDAFPAFIVNTHHLELIINRLDFSDRYAKYTFWKSNGPCRENCQCNVSAFPSDTGVQLQHSGFQVWVSLSRGKWWGDSRKNSLPSSGSIIFNSWFTTVQS